jgi:hypothetical protein
MSGGPLAAMHGDGDHLIKAMLPDGKETILGIR